MDAPIESNRRRTLIEEHARHYRFQLQLSRQPSDTLLGRLDREKDRGTFTVINLAKVASVAAQSAHTKHIESRPASPSISAPTSHPSRVTPRQWCTSMSLDLELAKILDEFSVPEAFRTKLVDSACLKVWQFAEYVDDVKDWTGILSSLEPPIVDRMHIASVRRAFKAACARDAELLSRGRDY